MNLTEGFFDAVKENASAFASKSFASIEVSYMPNCLLEHLWQGLQELA